MNSKAKLPVILLIILMLVSFVAASFGFYLYHKEHLKNIELEDRIEELSTRYKISEAKFLEAQKILSTIEVRLKEATAQIDDLTNELKEERESKIESVSYLNQVKSDLEELKAIKSDLEDKLKQTQDEAVSMQDKLGILESEKNELETRVTELEGGLQGVELGKIVVSPESEAGMLKAKGLAGEKKGVPEKPLEGKILVVNKEYNFAVINLGAKDGIGIDQVFSIYRGNSYIGDIKVEKLHDSMAAAGFISEGISNKVKEGDRVVKKG